MLHIIRDPVDVVLGFRESALEDDGVTFNNMNLRLVVELHKPLQTTTPLNLRSIASLHLLNYFTVFLITSSASLLTSAPTRISKQS